MSERAVVPIQERRVNFYGDEIVAVLIEQTSVVKRPTEVSALVDQG